MQHHTVRVTKYHSVSAWFDDPDLRGWIDHFQKQGLSIRFKFASSKFGPTAALFRQAIHTHDYIAPILDAAWKPGDKGLITLDQLWAIAQKGGTESGS